jgi:hypothetical protein
MEGGWGVMHHYRDDGTNSLRTFNEQTDSFDVESLAGQLKQLGARWLTICLCHNASSRFWCSPNETLDNHAGRSVCSRRDLVAGLAEALSPSGIRVIAYLFPSNECIHDKQTEAALAVDFPKRWCEVIREYSLRWGTRVAGWWFDGQHRFDDAQTGLIAEAARAGNPLSVLAFSGGYGHLDKYSAHDDYCGGEELTLQKCPGQYDKGALRHLLTPIGAYWGGTRESMGRESDSTLRKTDDELRKCLLDWVVDNRAAVTLDLPLRSANGIVGSLGGVVPGPYYRQLSAVAEALAVPSHGIHA